MFEVLGYALRLPGFIFGSVCNAIFSPIAFVVGNIFGFASYIFIIAITPFVFLKSAYSNDRGSWEKHAEELAAFPFFLLLPLKHDKQHCQNGWRAKDVFQEERKLRILAA
jgi:hypothetical protein